MKAKYLFGLFIVNLLDYTVHIKIKYLFRDMSEEDKT